MRETLLTMVSKHLSEILARQVNLGGIDPTTELGSLGLDSILTISVLVNLSGELNVDLSEYVDKIVPPQTVEDLISLALMFQEEGHVN